MVDIIEPKRGNKILKFLKDNSSLITSIGGLLLIFSLLGFNFNIPNFYESLDFDGKIILIFSINFIITIVLVVLLYNEIQNIKKL
ncbi:MAG: hypothetical protein GQ533_07945 [Methanosarcinaceae archaeon]|nr:hypothetical protein [Methanosarcinaceae archaeon]